MCSSGVAIAYFCAWEANSRSRPDADVVAVCSIDPSWWPISQKSTIKRLRNTFGTLQIFSLTKTLPLWRIGHYRELISWYPASKLPQALNPLKLRHLYRTVTSGRLGAKRLCLSELRPEGIFTAVGEFQHHRRLVCYSVEADVFHKVFTTGKRKYMWLFMKMTRLERWASDLQEFPLNTLKTGSTVRERLPGKARSKALRLCFSCCSFRRELRAKMIYRISSLVSSYLVHQRCFSSSVTVDIQASPRTTTLHKASSTLRREDGVAGCVQQGSGLPLVLLNTEDRHAAWLGEARGRVSVRYNSWPWGCWELRRGLRGSDCAAGKVRSQSTCRWQWRTSWHFASPASPCAPSHLCPRTEKDRV